MSTVEITTAHSKHQVPEKKLTSLGLYVTAQEAYEMWKADSENVHIIDVRTPEEYRFIGHAPMAKNIPLVFLDYQWNANKGDYSLTPNASFVARVKELFRADDKLAVVCRSGTRSALAVNMLAKAGFVNVYNIIDGSEGDKENDPASPSYGKRIKTGWKNSSLPWTEEVKLELVWLPTHEEVETLQNSLEDD
jgi:rhodanese-related sulfurtransferase